MKLLIGGKSRNIYMRKDGSAYYKSGGEKVDASYMFKKNGDFKKQYSKSVEETLTKVKESHHIKNNKKFYEGGAKQINFVFEPITVKFAQNDDNEKKKELMKIVHIAYNVVLEQLHTKKKSKPWWKRVVGYLNRKGIGKKLSKAHPNNKDAERTDNHIMAILDQLKELLNTIIFSHPKEIDDYYLIFTDSISKSFSDKTTDNQFTLLESVIEVADTIRKRIASEVAPAQAQTNGPVQTNDDTGENRLVVVRQPARIEDETAPSNDDAVENSLLLEDGPVRQPRQFLLKDRQHIDIDAVD